MELGAIAFVDANLNKRKLEELLTNLFKKPVTELKDFSGYMDTRKNSNIIVHHLNKTWVVCNSDIATLYLGHPDEPDSNVSHARLHSILNQSSDILVFEGYEYAQGYSYRYLKNGNFISARWQFLDKDDNIITHTEGQPTNIEKQWLDAPFEFESVDDEMVKAGIKPRKIYYIDDYHEALEDQFTLAIIETFLEDVFDFVVWREWDESNKFFYTS